MLKICIAVALVALLAGCQSYRDGSARTVGQFTDDLVIESAVKTKLIADEDIKAFNINVEVNRSVVSLYGRVPSEAARSKALRLAGEARGVVQVIDRLTLIAPE
ncbi:MAG: BON domain-containing protein [bacterium]